MCETLEEIIALLKHIDDRLWYLHNNPKLTDIEYRTVYNIKIKIINISRELSNIRCNNLLNIKG